MNVDISSIIKGIQNFEGGQGALAQKAGIKRQTVNAAVTAREGLSLPAAKAITKSLPGGGDPVALYVASQCAAMKRENPAPEEVLRRVSVVAKTLRAGGDLGEGEALKAALGELGRLNNEALANTTPMMESLERKASGLSKKSRHDGQEDATEEKSRDQAGPHGRKADGTRARKRVV